VAIHTKFSVGPISPVVAGSQVQTAVLHLDAQVIHSSPS
jgi:hypothetical protein